MTKKWMFPVLGFLAIAGGCTICSLLMHLATSYRSAEEKKVNSVLLHTYGPYVEKYSMTGSANYAYAHGSLSSLSYTAAAIPKLETETIQDFQQNNRNMFLYLKYDVLPNYNIWLGANDFPTVPDGTQWIILSRVGFNSNYTQALVFVGTYTGNNVCSRFFVFLKKVADHWVVVNTQMSSDCGLP